MKKDENKGFSLIELIIVMGILSVLIAGVVRISGVQEGWKLIKCTQLMESTLNKAKVQAMSKGNVAGIVYYQLNGTYYGAYVKEIDQNKEPSMSFDLSGDNVVETVALGTSPIKMTFFLSNTSGEVPVILTDNTDISNLTNVAVFSFNRSSGSIHSVKIGGLPSNYSEIIIENSNSTRKVTYEVKCLTGKIIVKE